MSRKQKAPVDPVILIMLGILFMAVAIGLAVVQGSSGSSIAIARDSAAMSQILVAFVTGLTTGGLSCLAVQGGLLAGTLAHQIEEDYTQQAVQKKTNSKNKAQTPARTNAAQPILLFLAAKIVAYTLLGALPGSAWVVPIFESRQRVPF